MGEMRFSASISGSERVRGEEVKRLRGEEVKKGGNIKGRGSRSEEDENVRRKTISHHLPPPPPPITDHTDQPPPPITDHTDQPPPISNPTNLTRGSRPTLPYTHLSGRQERDESVDSRKQ
jgi:hypothetical protein